MSHALPALRHRRLRRASHHLLSMAVLAGWIVMPLMPVIALALTWLRGLS